VLSLGGKVEVRVIGSVKEVTVAKELPAKPFEFVNIQLAGNNAVTAAGLECFKGLTNLTVLTLSNIPLTDSWLEPVKTLKNLSYLDLHGTKVTATGFEILRKTLPKCRIVPELPPK
jgi:hypothetical protein